MSSGHSGLRSSPDGPVAYRLIYSYKSGIRCPEQLHYSLGKTIGSGTYAKVKAAWSPYERKMIAIKILEKRSASLEVLTKFLPREMATVQRLNHQSILRVFGVVETPLQVYFMLEMAENGDLLDYINTCKLLPESQARYVMRSIAAGTAHCHSKDIVHRDLKCENIMITKDMSVKIGDFGFARQVGAELSPVTTPCGSLSYAAPELMSGRAGSVYDGKKVDIWSMGCILYAMVCGSLPFGDDTQAAQMMAQPLKFPQPLTTECKDLLKLGMLNVNARKRFDVTELRISPWMRSTARPLTPYSTTKHLAEDCLPNLNTTQSIDRAVYSQPRPVWGVSQSARPRQPPTDTASVRKAHHSSSPPKKTKNVMRGKISSAGKKLVQTILHRHSSSPRIIK